MYCFQYLTPMISIFDDIFDLNSLNFDLFIKYKYYTVLLMNIN